MYTTLIQEKQVKQIAIYVHGLGSGAASTTPTLFIVDSFQVIKTDMGTI